MSAARLAALVRLFASPVDAEAVAALRATGKLLADSQRDFHWLADVAANNFVPVTVSRPSWQLIAEDCLRRGHGRLKPFEYNFLTSMTRWSRQPSAKQRDLLDMLAARFQVAA